MLTRDHHYFWIHKLRGQQPQASETENQEKLYTTGKKEKIVFLENNLESEDSMSIYINCNVLNTATQPVNLNYKG